MIAQTRRRFPAIYNRALELLRALPVRDAEERLSFPWDELDEDSVRMALKIRQLRGSVNAERRHNKQLEERLDKLSQDFDTALAIKNSDQGLIEIKQKSTSSRHSVVPIILVGDWHVAEVVNKDKVAQLNEFNPEICEARVKALARNTVEHIKLLRYHCVFEQALIHLQGDFITGWIHPELEQTNAMPPAEEAKFAKTLLRSFLEFVAEHTKLRLTVVCSRGNHARLTAKNQFKNAEGTSLESMVYWDLQDLYPEFNWIVPSADLGFVDVLMPQGEIFTFRTFHGEQIRYRDGVGGITVPLNKLVDKWQRIKSANHNLFGHWHNYAAPSPTSWLNGSLKGFDEYAMAFGFSAELPMQTIGLLDLDRGMVTSRSPLFCE